MLFLVIKEFEPEECAENNENVVDNTVYVVFNSTFRDFDLYVNRRDTQNIKFVPYNVRVDSIKKVISFLKYIFFQKSTLQIDMYHGQSISDRIEYADSHTIIGCLESSQKEKYSVAGFTRSYSTSKSFRIIKDSLKQLKAAY